MSSAFVIDASVAVAWVHPGQATEKTRALLEEVNEGAMVETPALWPLEVANALLVLVRRKKLTEAERGAALQALMRLSVKFDHEMSSLAFAELSDLAIRHGLSVYDAAYLELCLRRKLPLGCTDGALMEAAKKAGVKVL